MSLKQLGLFAVCLMLSGCGGAAVNDKPKSEKVTGKITLDGSPLANALVTFSPTDKRDSTGTTDAEGRYELKFGPNPGAVVGNHTVRIITKIPGVQQHDARGEVIPDNSPERVPPKYNVTTELNRDVVEGKANVFDFELSSK